VLNKLCAGQGDIKNNIRAGQEELRKNVKDLRADVETEKSAIQDGIKNDVIAVKEDNEDLIENSTSTVAVGQEDHENRSLKLEAVKVIPGPPTKLPEVTTVRGGTPPTPPERRRDGRPGCWRCGKPGHFRRERGNRPREKKNQSSEAMQWRTPASGHSPHRFTLNVRAEGTEDRLIADCWIQEKP
jgi:hypothetical protein